MKTLATILVTFGMLIGFTFAASNDLLIGAGVGLGLQSKIKKGTLKKGTDENTEIKSEIHVQPSVSVIAKTDVGGDAKGKNTSGVLYGLEFLYSGGLDKKDKINFAGTEKELGLTTRNFVVLANAGYAYAIDEVFSVYGVVSVGSNFYTIKNDGRFSGLEDIQLKNTSGVGVAFGGGVGVMVNVTDDILVDVSAKFYNLGTNKIESKEDVAIFGEKLKAEVENIFPSFALKVHYKLPL